VLAADGPIAMERGDVVAPQSVPPGCIASQYPGMVRHHSGPLFLHPSETLDLRTPKRAVRHVARAVRRMREQEPPLSVVPFAHAEHIVSFLARR
jgi:hypothetical protein